MQSGRINKFAVIGAGLFIVGCARGASRHDVGELPTCTNAPGCNPGRGICTFPDTTRFRAAVVISDRADGLSSDGLGPYVNGTPGVLGTGVGNDVGMSLISPRKITVNLDNPVPRGGGVPLGIVTDGNDSAFARDAALPWFGLHTQWKRVGNDVQNLHNIAVGQTVPAAQMNVFFHISGRFHILQMGPQPFGHCHVGTTLVNGRGTSSGTIYRASQTKWVVDLPAGSVGRLFDLSHTVKHAVDRGLYRLQLHYQIGN